MTSKAGFSCFFHCTINTRLQIPMTFLFFNCPHNLGTETHSSCNFCTLNKNYSACTLLFKNLWSITSFYNNCKAQHTRFYTSLRFALAMACASLGVNSLCESRSFFLFFCLCGFGKIHLSGTGSLT